MRLLFLFAVILPFSIFAQTGDVIEHYGNGNIRFRSHKVNDSTMVYVEYFRNGNTKDSVMLKNELPFGTRTLSHKNGRDRYVIIYKSSPGENTFKRFRRDGSLKATGGNLDSELFGPQYKYNRKGVAVSYQDMNKGKSIKVPEQYRKGQHLTGKSVANRFRSPNASLKGNSKSVTIKSGAMISMRLKGDTEVVHHYQIEGFSKDSLLLSKFRYDISRSRNTLAFESNKIIAFDQIDAIYFGRNNSHAAEVVALAVTTAGFILLFEPILIVPIFQGIEALAEPVALGMMASGIPVIFFGKHLNKKIVPREYQLSQWQIEVK